MNATLAGGVSLGASADLITNPGGAMTVGFITGIVSAFGYANLTGFLRKRVGLHDTCGVTYLHFIPGIMGGIISAIVVAVSDGDE